MTIVEVAYMYVPTNSVARLMPAYSLGWTSKPRRYQWIALLNMEDLCYYEHKQEKKIWSGEWVSWMEASHAEFL